MECKLCDFRTNWDFVYKNHLFEHKLTNVFGCTENLKNYFCQGCKTSFKTKVKQHYHLQKYKKHKSIINIENQFKNHPKNKCKSLNETQLFKCALCNYASKTKKYLQTHNLYKHTSDDEINWLKCKECDFKTKTTYHLNRHIKRRHTNFVESERFKCAHCEYSTIIKDQLKSHILYKHTPDDRINWCKCKECDYKTKNFSDLKLHFKRKHSNSEEQKTFKCTECDHSTFTRESLKLHILCKHTPDDQINWWRCKECDYLGKTKYMLKYHILCKHTPDDRIDWRKCKECDYKAKTLTGLKQHIKMQHECQKFKCAKCDYSCNLISKMKLHVSSTHIINRSKFQCEQCDYFCISKSNEESCNNNEPENRYIINTAKDCPEKDKKININMPQDEMITPENNLEENLSNPKNKSSKKRREHNCIYCGVPVHNFARHLQRRHSDEIEVQKFLKLPKNDDMRKHIIGTLRKKGDFSSGQIIAVQCKGEKNADDSSKLPCVFCSGYYSKATLYMHVRRCQSNPNKKCRQNYQSMGQSYMANHFCVNDILKTSGLLSSLKADDISLVAKKDKLICEVGRKCIKSRNNKHVTLLGKRSMRRLARLLISVREIEEDNSLNMIDILHPSKFSSIIQAIKSVADYDHNTNTFKLPSLALQMETLLKKAIKAACYIEKQNNINSPLLKILDQMSKILRDNWAIEIETGVCQNVSLKKSNKPPIIPLIQDLQKIKNYLDDRIKRAALEFKADTTNEKPYRQLIEGSYCYLFLYNNRRMIELQRISVDYYKNHLNNIHSGELEKFLTPPEKIVSNKLKYVMVKGKQGREVPVIIDETLEEVINLTIEYRENFFDLSNSYLFGLIRSDNPISGYHVFRKLVRLALNDVNKTPNLTSPKLRKHLAIIAQIMKMAIDDLEELARFMGHNENAYVEWYKLPSDVNQLAKISKILILSQNKDINQYKGKNLAEIEIDESIIETEDDEEEGNGGIENESLVDNRRRSDNKIVKTPWTKEEKYVAENYFEEHIRNKTPPKKREVECFINLYQDIFSKRRWEVIKAYVCNQYKKK